MADLKISALNSLAGADLVAADVVAVVDDSASETKKLTVSDLIANGSTLISDNTIPSAKILFSAGAIDTAELAASSVETAKINDSAVTAAKLADNSSVTLVSTLPGSGDFTGQIALDTDDNKIYIWDGSAWDSVKGAGSINVVNGSTTGEINIVTSTSGDTVTISATLDDTSAAAQFLGGPTGAGGTVGYRALVGTDLPTATTSAKGGVIVNGNGLTMSGDTITIDNTVTAETTDHHIVKYDANGLVTAGRAIAAGDLPVATSSATGAVKPGAGLGVDAAGEISHSNSITGATAAKVTFDAQGHITATEALAASDIPDLDTAKITTGTFPEARIGAAAVSGAKLKDYAVAQISETTPTAEFTSQFFFNPITRDLFLWDGNVFQPVGISAGEIVLAGTYDASTNLLDSVTADGTAAGFTNGASLPSAATGNNRHYVVVSQSGTGSAPAPTVTLEPPDILLSNGTSYVLIETSETITAQIASNVGFTATGNIAATNVQAAVAEVDSEKVAKAGDTMTGNLNLGEDVVLTFEGATSNDFETTLTVVDPTADRSLSLPNISGTLISSGDTGTVTSTMITDGTIVNADISASAEIAVSKLGNGSARQVLQTDSLGTGVEFSDDLDLPGTLDVTGAATLDSTLAVTGATTVTGVINADGKVKFPAGSASAPSFYSGTDTNTGLYFSAADEIAITTGGTQRVVVDSSGNVGIGTTSPAQPLDIVTSGADAYIRQSNGTVTGFVGVNNANSAFDVYTFSSHPTRFFTNNTERMRIDSAGRVGINNTAMSNFTGNSSDNLVVGSGSGGEGITVYSASDNQGSITFADGISGDAAYRGAVEYSHTTDRLAFRTAGTGNRMVVDSSGRVGIGETSMDALLVIKGNSDANTTPSIRLKDGTDTREAWITNTSGDLILSNGGNDNVPHCYLKMFDGNIMTFATANTERMRIDSSGNVGIGTTSPSSFGPTLQVAGTDPAFLLQDTATAVDFFGTNITSGLVTNWYDDAAAWRIGTASAMTGSSYTERLRIDSSGNVGIGVASLSSSSRLTLLESAGNAQTLEIKGANSGGAGSQPGIKFTASSGDNIGGIYGDTNADAVILQTGGTERMRIDSSGNVLIGKNAAGIGNAGIELDSIAQDAMFTTFGATPLFVNRTSNDGVLISLQGQSVEEGSISVSGTTVSYNGAHLSRWSQLPSGAERTEILRGSVLSNLDEMCEWGEEDNEQLNRMQVSNVEGDRNVSGVFQAWDDDDDTYTNDFYCAMTGDFVIRIAQGTTVARGDLLMSAGDGTAKPQYDDIVRSKTIAKVTSTIVSETYSDGSYCVPCVLMAC